MIKQKYELNEKLEINLVEDNPFMVTPYSMYLAESFPLICNITEEKHVLDFGSGCGIQSIVASLCGAKHVYAVDIYQEAIYLTNKSFELNNLTNFTAINSSKKGWEDSINEKIDIIISNPASLPSLNQLPASFWAGEKGDQMIYELINIASKLLSEEGCLIFIHTSLVCLKSTLNFLFDNGFRTAIVKVKKLAFRDFYNPLVTYWETLKKNGESYFYKENNENYELLYLIKAEKYEILQ